MPVRLGKDSEAEVAIYITFAVGKQGPETEMQAINSAAKFQTEIPAKSCTVSQQLFTFAVPQQLQDHGKPYICGAMLLDSRAISDMTAFLLLAGTTVTISV